MLQSVGTTIVLVSYLSVDDVHRRAKNYEVLEILARKTKLLDPPTLQLDNTLQTHSFHYSTTRYDLLPKEHIRPPTTISFPRAFKMAEVMGPFSPLNYLIGFCSLAGIWMTAVQLDRAQLNLTMYDGMKSLFTVPEGNVFQHAKNVSFLEPNTCQPCLYYISAGEEVRQLGKEVPDDKCCPNGLLPFLMTKSTSEQPTKQEPTCQPCLYYTSASGELRMLGKEVPEHECCPNELLPTLIPPSSTINAAIEPPMEPTSEPVSKPQHGQESVPNTQRFFHWLSSTLATRYDFDALLVLGCAVLIGLMMLFE